MVKVIGVGGIFFETPDRAGSQITLSAGRRWHTPSAKDSSNFQLRHWTWVLPILRISHSADTKLFRA